MKQLLLGPVNFQGMSRPQVTAATAQDEAPATSNTRGLQVFGSKTFVDKGLIEQQLYRPYVHHQAENLWTATQEMAGDSWGNTAAMLPGHISNKLQSVVDYHT